MVRFLVLSTGVDGAYWSGPSNLIFVMCVGGMQNDMSVFSIGTALLGEAYFHLTHEEGWGQFHISIQFQFRCFQFQFQKLTISFNSKSNSNSNSGDSKSNLNSNYALLVSSSKSIMYIKLLLTIPSVMTCEACVKLVVVQSPVVDKIWALPVKFAPR